MHRIAPREAVQAGTSILAATIDEHRKVIERVATNRGPVILAPGCVRGFDDRLHKPDNLNQPILQ